MLLEYDMRIIGRRAVEAEFASLERRLQQHNQTVARATRPPAGARAVRPGGVAAETRAAAAAEKQAQRASVAAARQAAREKAALERQLATQQQYWHRARSASEQQRHAQEIRNLRTREREERRAARIAFSEARQVRAHREAFVRSTLGDTGRRLGGIVRGVGAAGLALAGIGGATLAAGAINQASTLDEGSRRLAIQGRDPGTAGANADDLRRKFTQVGIATGVAPEQVMAGAAAYTAETGDLGSAMSNLQTFATTAQATGSSIEEIATAAAHLRKLGITSVDDMQRSLASLTMQGKKGSFELKNMAAEFPEITAQAASFGVRGVSGLRQVGGLMQVAKTATGSGSEASTAVQTMFRQLAASSKDIQSGKSFSGRKVNVFEGGNTKGELRDFREVLGDVLVASRGDLPQLQDVFDVRGIKAVNPLISKFRETRTAALKGGASESQANTQARAAALAILDDAANVSDSFVEIQRDAADAMKSFSVQMETLNTMLKDAIASEVFPELVKLGPSLRELVPVVGRMTRTLVSAVQWLESNPWQGVGAAVAAAVGLSIGKAAIGEAVAKALTAVILGSRIPIPGPGGVPLPGGPGDVPTPGTGVPPVVMGPGGKLGRVATIGGKVLRGGVYGAMGYGGGTVVGGLIGGEEGAETGSRIGAGAGMGAALGPAGAAAGAALGALYDSVIGLYEITGGFQTDAGMSERAKAEAAHRQELQRIAHPPPVDDSLEAALRRGEITDNLNPSDPRGFAKPRYTAPDGTAPKLDTSVAQSELRGLAADVAAARTELRRLGADVPHRGPGPSSPKP